ncbi:MAG: TolC family protein, partial [Bacteroidales bacterium]|nr:TolC family protein [Bacteroidales bacterium]
MNRLIFIWILGLLSLQAMAQQAITLEECYDKAIAYYPLSQQEQLLQSANDLTIEKLNKTYLPKMAVNGQASYQSDVTKVPIQEIPAFSIEPLSKDWYKLTLDVNQIIYDGSQTKNQKQVEDIGMKIDKQNLQVEYHNLKERINLIYFAILLQRSNKEILQLHLDNLNAKIKEVKSGVENGVLLATNENVLKAEILKIEQSVSEVEANLEASIRIMEKFTGMTISNDAEFIVPEIEVNTGTPENNRPEMTLFSLQQEKLEASKKLTGSRTLPRLSAFGQAGYGRPGFDMLKNEFTDFYIVGAKLSWNFWDWNQTKKEKEIMGLQQQIIESQRQT